MTEINQNTEFTLTLTLNETNLVLAGLQELPARVANPLTTKIKMQAETQVAELQRAVAEQPAA